MSANSSSVLAEVEVFNKFEDMDLPDQLLRGVYSIGFQVPSAIQKRGIVPIKEGRDVLAQAQSGTGKTGTFTIGSLTRVDPKLNEVQVLVLVPTHELANQIHDVAKTIGSYMGLKVHSAIGKVPIKNDIQAIKSGCHFLVGTPGRIYDLCHRGILSRDHIRVLILDEADQMLEERFQKQVVEILKLGFPEQTRTALFSATMPPDMVKFTDGILVDPVRILVATEEVTLDGIKQFYVELPQEEWKFDVLCDIYAQLTINQAIIYVRTRQRAEWLAMKMKDAKFTLECIHGEQKEEERKKKMDDFRSGNVRVLIATDLLARGIDVQQVSLVINFELPTNKENYIHRIGRSGRFGRKGTAINIISGDEVRQMKEIESYYATHIEALPQNLASITL